jgi:hypothetical protein
VRRGLSADQDDDHRDKHDGPVHTLITLMDEAQHERGSGV